MKYIAYGSNMVKEQMAFRCPDARLIGTGHITGAQLEFYLHATITPSRIKGASVPVAIWEISKSDEQHLDMYEGYPNYYVKEKRAVQMDDGSKIKGMIYIMKLIRSTPPSYSYYNCIANAYTELGLATEIKSVLEPALKRSLRRKWR